MGNNLVCLTAREHFVIHRLLPKMFSGPPQHLMLHALWRLIHGKNSVLKISAREYAKIKEFYSPVVSKQWKGVPKSLEQKIKIARAHLGTKKPKSQAAIAGLKGRIPWNKGKSGLQVPWNKGIPISQKVKDSVIAAISKNWELISPLGEVTIIKNLNGFCKANGLTQAAMWRVSANKQKAHKGWKCKLVA